MISTVTNQGKVEFMIYSGNMNADVLILFLTKLTKNKEHKTFLILDNLQVRHNKVAMDWMVGKEATIELFFLPAYSPEGNPDEYLNCDLKLERLVKDYRQTRPRKRRKNFNRMLKVTRTC